MCVEVVWTYRENGGPVGKEDNGCEVGRKAINGMDRRYEESIE